MRELFGNSMYKLLGTTTDVSWLCSSGNPEGDGKSSNNRSGGGDESTTKLEQDKAQWRRKTRESAAKSKTGLWGPTHSFSSEESGLAEEKKFEIDVVITTPPRGAKDLNGNGSQQGTVSTKSSPDSYHEGKLNESSLPIDGMVDLLDDEPLEAIPCTLGRVWNNLHCLEDRTLKDTAMEEEAIKKDEDIIITPVAPTMQNKILDLFDEVCSPCQPKNLEEYSYPCEYDDEAPLGISRLAPPNACLQPFSRRSVQSSIHTGRSATIGRDPPSASQVGDKSMTTTETPAERRRSRHKRRQLQESKSAGGGGSGGVVGDSSTTQEAYEVTPEQVVLVRKDQDNKSSPEHRPLPVESLELNTQTAEELQRCISELTMRSSYGEATAKIAENRRMAYYAVGRHHRQSGRGGNRRCYFTGKLILGGAPFYAGSVQQGLRTLVVFCLPSAVGLPLESEAKTPLGGSLSAPRRPSLSSRSNASVAHSRGNPKSTTGSLLSRKGSKLSRLSSVDDTSVEEELDPNWELDKEYLLSVLPEPSQDLLDEMALRYPAQFETLPVQVRSPRCWKLYVKFCFFSGLPIAEGEMHYKVRDSLANQYGEEIILSHEVMEAVNGDSAEILRLPNMKTFRYLRKHYHQQSAKLPDSCFQRQAWEKVRPEV